MCIYVGGSVNYRFFPTAFAAYSITGVGLKRTILLKLVIICSNWRLLELAWGVPQAHVNEHQHVRYRRNLLNNSYQIQHIHLVHMFMTKCEAQQSRLKTAKMKREWPLTCPIWTWTYTLCKQYGNVAAKRNNLHTLDLHTKRNNLTVICVHVYIFACLSYQLQGWQCCC